MDKKGKIYKLYCEDGHYYYGSTIDKYLSKRFHNHKCHSTDIKYKDNKIYSHIHSIGWDKVKIILVEEFDYTTRDDMRKRENAYIVASLNDSLCLNHNRSFITDDERLQKAREYKEKMKSDRNEIIECECGIKHTKGREAQHLNSVRHKTLMGC